MPIENEDELQRLFEQHTNLIPLKLDRRRKLVREFMTDAGPIDHVGVDAEGNLLVLETKLARNTTRRRVIAQAIDYAAQIVKLGTHSFLDKMRERAGDDFTRDWFQNQEERDNFHRNLESNLREGRLTMLIVMDDADEQLKDAIRFLTRATHFSCMLAIVRAANAGGKELVSVDLYGEELFEEKTEATALPRRKRELTSEEFIATKKEQGLGEEARAYIKAIEWAKANGATDASTPSGIYVGQDPFVSYNYLGWWIKGTMLELWSSGEVLSAMHHYLGSATEPWKSRIQLRPLPTDVNHGKVADIEVKGTTEKEFKQLFDFYIQGPKPGS